jgi:polysaccharide export outer membrane protein
VTQVNSKKIYVIGAVKKEGPVPIRYQMTVLQVLTEAGGITDYAKRKKIYVLRTENGRQYRLPFNYEEVIRGEKIEQNIWVMADDTVVVPN